MTHGMDECEKIIRELAGDAGNGLLLPELRARARAILATGLFPAGKPDMNMNGEWERNGFGYEDKPEKLLTEIKGLFELAFHRKPDMNLLTDKEFVLEAVKVYKSSAGICSKCDEIALTVDENDGLCQSCSNREIGNCDSCGLFFFEDDVRRTGDEKNLLCGPCGEKYDAGESRGDSWKLPNNAISRGNEYLKSPGSEKTPLIRTHGQSRRAAWAAALPASNSS